MAGLTGLGIVPTGPHQHQGVIGSRPINIPTLLALLKLVPHVKKCNNIFADACPAQLIPLFAILWPSLDLEEKKLPLSSDLEKF